MITTGHLSDDRLLEVCLTRTPEPREQQHLELCPECAERRASTARLLSGVVETVHAQADAHFPAERLARQQDRILHRLAHEGRPGRVIAFPAWHAHESRVSRARPGMRWIAGAAAAGLIIGLVAGHLVHELPAEQAVSAPPRVISRSQPAVEVPAARALPTTLSEEEFLGRLEVAVQGTGGLALRPLDDLTPRVWEVSAR